MAPAVICISRMTRMREFESCIRPLISRGAYTHTHMRTHTTLPCHRYTPKRVHSFPVYPLAWLRCSRSAVMHAGILRNPRYVPQARGSWFIRDPGISYRDDSKGTWTRFQLWRWFYEIKIKLFALVIVDDLIQNKEVSTTRFLTAYCASSSSEGHRNHKLSSVRSSRDRSDVTVPAVRCK